MSSIANFQIGAGDIYFAPAGTVAPADGSLNTAPGSPWLSVGFMEKDTDLDLTPEYVFKEVQQVAGPVAASLKNLKITLKAMLSEHTLANINLALNNRGTVTEVAASGGMPAVTKLAVNSTPGSNVFSIIVDEVGIAGLRRRIYLPQVIAMGTTNLKASKDNYGVIAAEWEILFPADRSAPVIVLDAQPVSGPTE